MQKEKWGRPKLIVLIKGDPGERVLIQCKVTDNDPPFVEPSVSKYGCWQFTTESCGASCQLLSGS